MAPTLQGGDIQISGTSQCSVVARMAPTGNEKHVGWYCLEVAVLCRSTHGSYATIATYPQVNSLRRSALS
jgi:hypothetical protein